MTDDATPEREPEQPVHVPSLANIPAQPAKPQRLVERWGPIMLLVGGGLVALGSLMPWASLSTGFVSASVNGTEGDGKLTVIAGVITAVLGLVGITSKPTRTLVVIGGLVGGAAGVLALYYIATLKDRMDVDASIVLVQTGIGLWLVLIGGIAAVVGIFAPPQK